MPTLLRLAHALGDPTRIRLFFLLRERALCVCELADILAMPQSSVSSHIQVIKRAGVLESERCEKWIYYRLDARSAQLLALLEEYCAAAEPGVLVADAMAARARIARREGSCCPGPRTLAGTARAKRGAA